MRSELIHNPEKPYLRKFLVDLSIIKTQTKIKMQRTLKICLAAILLAGTADAIGVEKRGRGRGGRGRGGRKGTCEDSRTRTIERFDEDCADAADPTACATAV